MRRLHWLMIVLLLAGAGGLGYKLRADWRSFRASNNPDVIRLRPMPPRTCTNDGSSCPHFRASG